MATLFRINDKGNWYLNYKCNGKQYKKSTSTSNRKLAEIKLKELEVQLFKGQYIQIGKERRRNSVPEFFGRYIEFSNATKSSATKISDHYRIKQIQDYFARRGVKFLEEITPGEIQQFQAFIMSDHNSRSYNNFLNLLKSILNKAVEWDVMKSNPIKSCKPLRVPKKIKYFSKEEIAKLYENADHDMKLLLSLALYAGLRRNELYFLRWKDIDLRYKQINVSPHGEFTPKNKKSATVPISLKLLEIIKNAWPKKNDSDDSQYIFGKYHKPDWIDPTHSLSKHFSYLAKKAGVKNAGLHDCRHTFASYLVQMGTPLLVVKELLRHSDIQSTMVYAHLAPNQQKQAIENLDF